jgi:hypothetical protein
VVAQDRQRDEMARAQAERAQGGLGPHPHDAREMPQQR